MIRAIDELTITDAVIGQMASTKSERLKEIMNAAVRHLHAFAREVNLAPDEWIEGIKFLTATGHACTEYRQEFILLSDTLGLSSLVNSLHDRRTIHESTKSSLLGPFYRQDSPKFELGQSIAENCSGEQIGVYGRNFDCRVGRWVDSLSIVSIVLVESGVCEEVRRPTGILRYLRMRRNPPMKKFASVLSEANFTTTQTGNLHEHIVSKRKGL